MNRYAPLPKLYHKAAYSRYVPEWCIRAIDKVLCAFHYHGVSCRGRNDHITAGPPHYIIDRGRWI